MRIFIILFSVFVFVMSTSISTSSTAGEHALIIESESRLSQIDQWVIRLASDFSVIQSNLEEMIVHYNVSDKTKDRLKLLEATLRHDVMKVIIAASIGDYDIVYRFLPSISRQVQTQILVLTVNKGVTRQWAAARIKAQETITQVAQIDLEMFRFAIAQIKEGGQRVQRI